MVNGVKSWNNSNESRIRENGLLGAERCSSTVPCVREPPSCLTRKTRTKKDSDERLFKDYYVAATQFLQLSHVDIGSSSTSRPRYRSLTMIVFEKQHCCHHGNRKCFWIVGWCSSTEFFNVQNFYKKSR